MIACRTPDAWKAAQVLKDLAVPVDLTDEVNMGGARLIWRLVETDGWFTVEAVSEEELCS